MSTRLVYTMKSDDLPLSCYQKYFLALSFGGYNFPDTIDGVLSTIADCLCCDMYQHEWMNTTDLYQLFVNGYYFILYSCVLHEIHVEQRIQHESPNKNIIMKFHINFINFFFIKLYFYARKYKTKYHACDNEH